MGTRGQWAKDFLHALGNAQPSEDIIKLVSAWTRVENTHARFNPLATTLRYGTHTEFNSVGVRNYSTREEGIAASVRTLDGNFSGYATLKDGLLTNDPEKAIFSGGFDTWGSHSNKVGTMYYAGDFSGEPLKGEETGSTTGGSWDTVQEPTPDRARPENERRGTQQSFSTVTEDDIRSIAKIGLGILFIATGLIIAVIALMKTDTAQAGIGLAASVATKGAI